MWLFQMLKSSISVRLTYGEMYLIFEIIIKKIAFKKKKNLIILFVYIFLVIDNGIGDHHQHNNHHQYQTSLARHQASKVDSHKSACVKASSQLSSPSTPTSIIPSSNVCTSSSSVTLPASSAGLPTGNICISIKVTTFFHLPNHQN